MLERGKYEEIEKILDLLKSEKIEIQNCLSVLAQGKYTEIKQILTILKKYHINVNKCLTVLAKGKAEEIENICIFLNQEGINIQNSLNILENGKLSSFETKINILRQYGALEEVKRFSFLNTFLFKDLSEERFLNIFLIEAGEKEGKLDQKELKFFFLIREQYNQYYHLEEIEAYSKKMKISVMEFLHLFKTDHKIDNYLYHRLKEGKAIWIGEKKGLKKETLIKHEIYIMKIKKVIAQKFIQENPKYSYLEEELEGFILDRILSTGETFFEEIEDQEILTITLISYYHKQLYKFIEFYKRTLNFDLSEASKTKYHLNEDSQNIENMSFFQKNLFQIEEYKILKEINYLVQLGGDHTDISQYIKHKHQLSQEEYNNTLLSIQRKITRTLK